MDLCSSSRLLNDDVDNGRECWWSEADGRSTSAVVTVDLGCSLGSLAVVAVRGEASLS